MLRALAAPILPAAAATAVAIVIWRRGGRDEPFPVRATLTATAVAIGVLVVVLTEALSALGALRPWPAFAWGVLAVAAAVVAATRHGALAERLRRAAAVVVAVIGVLAAARAAARVLADHGDVPGTSVLTAPRVALRFRQNRPLQAPYERAAASVRASGCESVGLELARDDWEYPFWVLLDAAAGGGPHLQAIGVRNESAGLPAEGVAPCAVISTRRDSTLAGSTAWSAEPIANDPFVAVYRQRSASR